MIRKLEKGEPLKVGDRIDIYGFSGKVTMIDDARPNYNYFNFCVEWPGCSAIRYCSADPFIERALLAPATITREEPGGKWTIQELEGILDPSGKPAITHDIVTALNDQAATIERLIQVIRDYADELQSGTQFSNLALQWQEDFGRMADAMRQEAEK